MLGNEAIARGAYEAGVKVSAAYPGTPSTEISENLVKYKDDIYAEWSPNEKVATEVAIGASVSGVRSMARGDFATIKEDGNLKKILFFFRNITVELTQEYILNTALQRTRIYPWYYDINRSEFTLDNRYFEHLGISA